MAVITPVICPATGKKGVRVSDLPTKYGYRQSFTAFGPEAFYEALKKWEKVRPRRAEIILFRLAATKSLATA